MKAVEKLQARRDALQSIVEKVLTFPSKVSYDGMVPISNIAFCPGKVIHTNEFKVLGEDQTERDLSSTNFTSYCETADILKLRLEALNSKIIESFHKSKYKAELQDIPPPSASELVEADSERVYEIREFYDEDGSVVMNTADSQPKHELVDISEELNKLEKLTQSPMDYKGSSLVQTDDDDFIRELSLMSSQNRSERSRMEIESMDDFFAALEAKQLQPRSKASPITAKSSNSSTRSNKNSNSGWKAGFLSSGGNSSEAKPQTPQRRQATANTTAVAVPTSNLPYDQGIPSEPKKRVKIVEDQNTTQIIDNRETMSDNMATMRLERRQEQQRIAAEARVKATVEEREARAAQRAKAFSGKIIEKFP